MLFPFNLFSFFNTAKKKVLDRTIRSDKDIATLLKRVQNHLVIITANFPGETKNFSTSIIKINYQNKLLYLDELLPYEGNSYLNKVKKVHLRAHLDNCILSMECRLKKQDEEKGLLYSIMYFPDTVKSIQNREYHRVNIPLNKHLKVVLKTEAGDFLTGSLNDISFNGIAIRFGTTQNINIENHALIPFTTIYLDNDIVISCKMTIKRIFSASDNTIIAGLLEEVTPSQQQNIQKFITRLDRLKRRDNEN